MPLDRQMIGDTLVHLIQDHAFALFVLTDEGVMQLTNVNLTELPNLLRDVADSIDDGHSTAHSYHTLTVPS